MKLWEIRDIDEDRYDRRYGARGDYMKSHKGDSYKEGYDCGYEDGYRAAMREAKSFYDEKKY